MSGISNETIVKFIPKSTSDDVKKKCIGVFPSNFVNKFINFHNMLLQSSSEYPFIIMNTDRANKKRYTLVEIFRYTSKKRHFLI